MGQKSNPIAFRLMKNEVTPSQWYAQYNYSIILHDDLIIRQIIHYLFRKKFMWVNQILIRRTTTGLFIFIYIFSARKKRNKINLTSQIEKIIKKYINISNQKINIYTYNYYDIYNLDKNKVLKRITKTFSHYHWLKFHRDFFRLAFVTVKTKNVSAFCFFFSKRITKTSKHKKMIKFITNLFAEFFTYEKDFVGVRIKFKGRLAGRLRAKKIYMQKGQVPLHTISATISYHLEHVYTRFGVFGLRFWLCFSQSKINFFNELNRKRSDEYKEKKKLIPQPNLFHLEEIINSSKKLKYGKVKILWRQKSKPQWWFSNQYKKKKILLSQTKIQALKEKKKFKKQESLLIWYFLYKYKKTFQQNFAFKNFVLILEYIFQKNEKNNYYRTLLNNSKKLKKKIPKLFKKLDKILKKKIQIKKKKRRKKRKRKKRKNFY